MALESGEMWPLESGERWPLESDERWPLESDERWPLESDERWPLESGPWRRLSGDRTRWPAGYKHHAVVIIMLLRLGSLPTGMFTQCRYGQCVPSSWTWTGGCFPNVINYERYLGRLPSEHKGVSGGIIRRLARHRSNFP